MVHFVPDPETAKEVVSPLYWGGGGLLLIAVLGLLYKIVDRILKSREGRSDTEAVAGSMSVDFWRAEIKEAVSTAMSEQLVPILDQQTKILDRIAETEHQQTVTLAGLATLAEEEARVRAARAAAAGT